MPSDAISQGADDLVARDRRQTPGHHLKSDRISYRRTSSVSQNACASHQFARSFHMLRGSVHGTFGFGFFLAPSPDEGGNQTPSERPSEATRQSPDEVGNQTPSEVIRGHEAAMGVVLGDSRFSKRSSGPPARSGMKKRCRESSSTAPLDACTTVEL